MRRATITSEAPSIRQLWLSLLYVLVASVAAAGVLWFAYQRNHILTGFFIVMFVVAAMALFASKKGALKQTVEIRAQRKLFEALKGPDLWGKVQIYPHDSYTWRCLDCARRRQFVSPGSEEFDVFLDGMQRHLSKEARFVRRCGEICANLGYLGTATGLMAMLSGLAGASAAGTISASEGDVFQQLFQPGGPMAELSTSFSTTVVGLGLRMVLSNVSTQLHEGAERITAHVAAVMAVVIGPAITED